ncbi:CHAT domain-containing protein [Nocardia arthritidis]|nr:CHAT domain-containing protein [Nocardia arthritidis]
MTRLSDGARRSLILLVEAQSTSSGLHVRLREGDRVLADRRVAYDSTAEEYAAFVDADRYFENHRVPGVPDPIAEPARRLGEWVSRELLGDAADFIALATPCTVVVTGAEALVSGPWELALVSERTLGQLGAVFVQSVETSVPPPPARTERSVLRVLAVFSQPDGLDALNLRRERRELQRTIGELARLGARVELCVLQYGATRRRLAEVAADPDGWDVVQLSGHGAAGSFTVEAEDSGRDPIEVDDLIALLAPARPSLVVLSSCRSAARIAEERMALLGLAEVSHRPDRHPNSQLAQSIAINLGCAVLAMRFAVPDSYVIGLIMAFYAELLREGRSVAEALEIARGRVGATATAIEWATSTVIGEGAGRLTLSRPRRADDEIPPPPERFVGRVAVMTKCGRTLTTAGMPNTVVLSGTPGVGKTTVAAELVDLHGDRFDQVVWFAIPENADPQVLFLDLLVRLETALPGLRLLDTVVEDTLPADALADLTKALASTRTLLVLEAFETLTPEGEFTHLGWPGLITALTAHTGASRLLATTRVTPRCLARYVEPIGLLTVDETVLLVGELGRLDRFVRGEVPDVSADGARALAAQAIKASGRHPKLLELADGQATDAATLRSFLDDADKRSAAEHDPRRLLEAWTIEAVTRLGSSARHRFDILCVLDDRDRTPDTVNAIDADPSATDSDDELRYAALAVITGHHYEIHPTVASSGRDLLEPEARQRITAAIATYWRHALERAVAAERTSGSIEPVARFARAVATYLVRSGDVPMAIDALDLILRRERSRIGLRALLPLAHEIVTTATGTDQRLRARRMVANIMALLAHRAAEPITAQLREDALAQGDSGMAMSLTTDLIGRYREANRYPEALALADEQIELGERTGAGPWTRLVHDNEKVSLLVAMGKAAEVAEQIEHLRRTMAELPDEAGENETVRPFRAKGLVLDTAYTAALALHDYDTCITVGEEMLALKRAYDADENEIARAKYRLCFPLMRRNRTGEALSYLTWCRTVFTRERDSAALAATLTALAELEDERGYTDTGIALARSALRHQYAARTLGGISNGHLNLGYRLESAGDRRAATAHHLIATLIATGSSYWQADSAVDALAHDLIELGDDHPTTAAELMELAERDLPGIEIPTAVTELHTGIGFEQADVVAILARAGRAADALREPAFTFWDPLLSGLLADDTLATEQVADFLDAFAEIPERATVATILRDPVAAEEPDEIDRAILRRADAVRSGALRLPDELWRLMSVADVLANIVGATHGDELRDTLASAELDEMAEDEPVLVAILHRIRAGERNRRVLLENLAPEEQLAVEHVLAHAAH